jgi:hypothetical protein
MSIQNISLRWGNPIIFARLESGPSTFKAAPVGDRTKNFEFSFSI